MISVTWNKQLIDRINGKKKWLDVIYKAKGSSHFLTTTNYHLWIVYPQK